MSDAPQPMHNLSETYATEMVKDLCSVIILVGLYKGSERHEHLEQAAKWLPRLERSFEGLKRELSK